MTEVLDRGLTPKDSISSFDEILIEAAKTAAARLDVSQMSLAMLELVQRLFHARACWMLLHDPATNQLVTSALCGSGAEYYADQRIGCGRGIVGVVFTRQRTVFVPDIQDETRWVDRPRMLRSELRSALIAPMCLDGRPVGVVGVDSPAFSGGGHGPTESDITWLEALGACAASGVDQANRFAMLREDRLRPHPRFRGRPTTAHAPDGREIADPGEVPSLLGNSSALRAVLDQVAQVAPAGSTVLVLGETGTGKELIARTLHARSPRSVGPFVALNCAALPESLIESELFGYEKGAFTGAVGRRAGHFELAHGGTLFLDEIGDLPPQVQVKLLRVLQEREVMRLGGTRPVPLSIRLIVATNQDLDQRVRDGWFRPDLFYRLSVFPIVLPPLRDRREDIPTLAAHFLRQIAQRLRKTVTAISPAAINRLIAHDWPGNVRELQNVVERAVILARRPTLGAELIATRQSASSVGGTHLAPAETTRPEPAATSLARDAAVSFRQAQQCAILRALESTTWRISGRAGAAELLGLKPTTLHAKMKKLGIRRPTSAALRDIQNDRREQDDESAPTDERAALQPREKSA